MKSMIKMLALIAILIWCLSSCEHEKDSADADLALYNATLTSDYIYYQDGALLNPAGSSPHGDFKLRFNSVAASSLDSISGELPMGSTFPTGSVIVKEAINNGAIHQLAVMMKDPLNDFAGSGWLWAEYLPNGKVVSGIGNRGEACISCHSSSAHRDLVATFDLH